MNRIRSRVWWAVAATACLAAARPAAAADADAAMLAAARAAEPAVIDTLRDMVAIESGSADAEGLAQMADYVERRLQALGATTERIKASRGPGSLVKAMWTGSGTKKLMLIAHMDTVYPHGTLAVETYHRDGNRLYGPGIADDKGGIAVVLHSLALLRAAGWQDYARLTVLFNPDEEVGSAGSHEVIEATAEQQDVVLSCEPTGAKSVSGEEGLALGTAGIGTATLRVTGRAAHAGAAPEQGRNALIELAFQLQQTKDVAKAIAGAQLNWTRAQAGVVTNQIPELATAFGDVRVTVPGADAALLAALTDKLASAHLVADTESTIKIGMGRPPYLADERGRALARQAQAIYAELDGRPLRFLPMSGGGTDAGFAARSGKPIVLEGFGLAGWGYHARDEYIEIDSIVPRLYLMARLLQTAARS